MIEVLLLLGLPASGKTEIGRYLDHLDPERRAADLRLGVPMHLRELPYFHLMRRISQDLRRRRADPVFFATDAEPLLEPGDWLTLSYLLDEDFAGLSEPPAPHPHPAGRLLDRFDRARAAAGLPPPFAGMTRERRAALEQAIEEEAADLLSPDTRSRPATGSGQSVVIELSRGAGGGMRPPYPAPWGYAHSLAVLSPGILTRAAILYLWVTPTESRRRNRERALPGRGPTEPTVPERILRHEFDGDDMHWLLDHADRSGHITLAAHGRRYHVPAVRFDNRIDRTSFLQSDPGSWAPARVADLHERLTAAFDLLLRRGRMPA